MSNWCNVVSSLYVKGMCSAHFIKMKNKKYKECLGLRGKPGQKSKGKGKKTSRQHQQHR
jgi:hypothetical protein